MKQIQRKRRGRPTHYKMSDKSKQMIRESKLGQKHTQETKDKISAGVLKAHETGAPIDILMKTNFDECAKCKNERGYVDIIIPNPTVGAASYQQRYHVAIMEKKLDRKLRKGEDVHHWGEKDDNRPMMITTCWNKREHAILDKAKKILDREAAMNRLTIS